jgi:DNA uptake protein ComE-like DNA-binding protein
MKKHKEEPEGHRLIKRGLVVVVLLAGMGGAGAAAGNPAAAAASAVPASGAAKKATPTAPAKLVDINSASRQQLTTLPGIGNAEADKIVAGRPYLSKADLATRHIIPTGVYVSIKGLIIDKQDPKRPPVAKAQP